MARLYGWPLVGRLYTMLLLLLLLVPTAVQCKNPDGRAVSGSRFVRFSDVPREDAFGIDRGLPGDEMLSSSSALNRLSLLFIPRLAMQTLDHFSWQMRKQELEPVVPEKLRCQSRRNTCRIFLSAASLCFVCALHLVIQVSLISLQSAICGSKGVLFCRLLRLSIIQCGLSPYTSVQSSLPNSLKLLAM